MLSPTELLRLHVEALFTLDPVGRLVRVNEPEGKLAPRFFLGRTMQGSQCWVRNDLADETVGNLRAVCDTLANGMEAEAALDISAPFHAVLRRSAPVTATWSGPAFVFPDQLQVASSAVPINRANSDLLRPHLEGWCEDVADGKTVYGVVVDNHAVSVCASVRETPFAHEAGVETAAPFRGHGYAGHAVGAWALTLEARGLVPLYSTSWINTASRSVARKLGLIQFASDLHIT